MVGAAVYFRLSVDAETDQYNHPRDRASGSHNDGAYNQESDDKYQMLRVEKLSSISALTAAHLFVYLAAFLFQFDDPARRYYIFFAAQRPLQPSARLYEPLPLLPDILPVAVKGTPSAPTLAAR